MCKLRKTGSVTEREKEKEKNKRMFQSRCTGSSFFPSLSYTLSGDNRDVLADASAEWVEWTQGDRLAPDCLTTLHSPLFTNTTKSTHTTQTNPLPPNTTHYIHSLYACEHTHI